MTRLFRLRPLVKPALETAGLDKSVGVMSTQYLKDPTDPGWADDAGMKEFQAWRAKYAPESDPANPVWVYGGSGTGDRAEAGGQRLVAREYHEGGDKPAGYDNAPDGVARDQDQLQSDRLQADEEHAVGSVRREDVQARSGVTPFCLSFDGW